MVSDGRLPYGAARFVTAQTYCAGPASCTVQRYLILHPPVGSVRANCLSHMLLIIVFWAWAAGVGLGFGLGLEKLLKRIWGPLPCLLKDSPELLIVGGLSVLAWLVAILSFALPVALPMQLGLSALSSVLLVTNRVRLRLLLLTYGGSWQEAGALAGLLAGALVVLILTHAAQPPTFPDSALYHAQFIQWMHRYPLVPGLGNLRGQLAFNSHAHLLTAFFSPATPT
ncbi:LIC_10190 family membrane protein [Hymenobacter sp. NBH84]|uniref:LIC_10190 family membrane protein n=1 Tax=Hymenobacter sp. NBH84 TaxID=2596915 RepID=UPI0035BBE23E